MLHDQFFHAAFHRSPIGQYLLAPTDKLEFLAVNDTFLSYVGRSRDDLLGRPLFDVFPNNPGDPHDTGVQDLAHSIKTSIETGVSQRMPAQRYPVEMQRDGQRVFVDMFWSATNTPIFDDAGTLLCVSHTTIDITAQVQAEQALRLSQEEALRNARSAETERASLAAVLRVAPVGILVVDAERNVLEKNPAHRQLFGDDQAGQKRRIDLRNWTGWFIEGERAGEQLHCDEWPLHHALAGESVAHCLLRIRAFDTDAIRTLMVSAAPILGEDGRVTGAVAVSMDIEARMRAEQVLQDADKRKDEFLAMLAHELRNPLAPIGAAASLLGRRGGDDQVRRTSEIITRQVRHMSSLVDDLLDVARVTRGLVTIDRTTVDVKAAVSEAIEQARPGMETRAQMLWVTLWPQPVFVAGDHKRLVQVLANLLHNASKFTPGKGLIQLHMGLDAHHVRLSVCDNGQGMTQELMARAFDLFAQGERTLDRAQGGLGIGLALVRSIVQQHEGTIEVHSDGAGRGTRFTIRLPLAERAATHSVGVRPPPYGAAPRALSILAVDDQGDALAMLAPLLTELGHRVTTCTDARDALRRAGDDPPDVCVLDIGLPDLDGHGLARALRADPRTRGAALIALSGYGQEADRRAAFAAGFDDYFVKPVDIDALSLALARLAPAVQG